MIEKNFKFQIFTLQVLVLPALLLVITSVLFLFNIPITFMHFILAFFGTIAISFAFVKRNCQFQEMSCISKKEFLSISGIFLLVIIIVTLGCLMMYDFSTEGQGMHQSAVIALSKGWNPFYEPLVENSNSLYKIALDGREIFLNHYPKASWITSAAVFKLTGSLESGKMFNFLYLIGVFFITWFFLNRFQRLPGKIKIIIAFLVTLNPVALYQLFSFSNDIQLAALLTIALILAFEYIMFRQERNVWLIFITFIPLVNVKFIGVVYGTAILILSWLVVFIIDRDLQKRFLLIIAGAFIISFFIVGYQPYIENIRNHGNPFFPAIGSSPELKADLAQISMTPAPHNFLKMNRFKKLAYSLFCMSDQDASRMPKAKVPFSIHEREITAFNNGSPRYGGFGPFFGSILFIVIITALIVIYKLRRVILLFSFIPAGVILVLTLFNAEAWWARLSPQLWLLPITFIVSFYYLANNEFMNYMKIFFISALIINCLLVGAKYTENTIILNKQFRTQVHTLADESRKNGKILLVYPNGYYLSTRNRLNDFGIRHQMVIAPIPQDSKPEQLMGTPNVTFEWSSR